MQPVCVIIGGGISGLAAAYELNTRHVPFVLVESSSRFGGLVKTEQTGRFVIDAGPDAIVTQKPAAIGLCRELGVGVSAVKTPGTFIARRSALHKLPETGAFGIPADWAGFTRTRAFSPLGKFRMAAEYFIRPGGAAATSSDESIASFMRRRFVAVLGRSDADLVRVVTNDARRYLGITAASLLTRVYRWPHAGIQLDVGHLTLMDEIDSWLARSPGLFVSAAGFRGVGIADCVLDARLQAAKAAVMG